MPDTETEVAIQSRDLIGPNDPPPFEVYNPEGSAPLLLICDHARPAIPEALGDLGLPPEKLHLHIAYDIGAANVARLLARRLDAPAVLSGYSRLIADCNRAPGDPTMMPAVSDNLPIPGNGDLAEDAIFGRLDTFFWPYHRAVAHMMARLWRRGPPPALFSVHSFTPSIDGQDRHWDIGVLWNRDPRMALHLIERLRAHDDLHVGDNEPYSGRDLAYSIDCHGAAAGLASCAVEIRQDHLETVAEATHWASLLGDALEDILGEESLHRVERY